MSLGRRSVTYDEICFFFSLCCGILCVPHGACLVRTHSQRNVLISKSHLPNFQKGEMCLHMQDTHARRSREHKHTLMMFFASLGCPSRPCVVIYSISCMSADISLDVFFRDESGVEASLCTLGNPFFRGCFRWVLSALGNSKAPTEPAAHKKCNRPNGRHIIVVLTLKAFSSNRNQRSPQSYMKDL